MCPNIVYSECDVNPCNNSGVCQYHAGTYMCTCSPEYSGPFCDIVLLVPTTDVPKEEQALSTGAIVGIVVGVVVAIALVVLVFIVVLVAAIRYHRACGDKQDGVGAKYHGNDHHVNIYENVADTINSGQKSAK